MMNYHYENHVMPNSLLPFIFHRDRIAHCPNGGIPNWHDNIELLFCYEGNGCVHCGPEVHNFSEGDLFVVNANVPHSFCSDGLIRYYCLIIDNSYFEANGIPISTLYFQKLIRNDEISRQYLDIVSAFDRYSPADICGAADIRYAVLGLMRLLCTDFTVQDNKKANSVSNERVKNAISFIRKNLQSPISLDDISEHVGISKYHLSREFKVFTGMTVIDTVNLIRCTEARRLIEAGASVSSAANSCGFENLSYFSRTFKKHFHQLPSTLLRKP